MNFRIIIPVFFAIIFLYQNVAIGYSQEGTDEYEQDLSTKTIMPDWFKNNAKWWKEDLISDTDMINALENLMIQEIIPLDKFVKSFSGLEHQADVDSSDSDEIVLNTKPQIPSYQKDVFGFWGEGMISDNEIINSIAHLMSKGIINSEKIQTEISERKEKYQKEFGVSDVEDKTSSDYGFNNITFAKTCTDTSDCDSNMMEACQVKDDETKGECITRWFGQSHNVTINVEKIAQYDGPNEYGEFQYTLKWIFTDSNGYSVDRVNITYHGINQPDQKTQFWTSNGVMDLSQKSYCDKWFDGKRGFVIDDLQGLIDDKHEIVYEGDGDLIEVTIPTC